MSSSRAPGRGRVLGSAAAAAAAAASKPPPQAIPTHVRKPSLLSPSESSVSVSVSVASSPSSLDLGTDISAAAAAQQQQAKDNVAAASASSRLVCPICNEEMVTLLQLNRHLDDAHQNLEVEETDEIQTWFKSQMIKARRFQPLAVLNQKLKGLDVFEENEDRRPASQQAGKPGDSAAPPAPRVVDADEVVTKDHWQRYAKDGLCSDPMCGRRLGGVSGNINCRHCGRLFCEEHTMYQMKLSRSATHEPVRGYWARVCETCYKSREGYNDHNGLVKDHTDAFAALRRKTIDRSYLEVSRLEKRLTRLTQLLADPSLRQEDGALGYLWTLSGHKSQRRAAEESVVDWEDDSKITHCPFCQQEFSNYSFRKHHCRTCGRVVCADPSTECSVEVGLAAAVPSAVTSTTPAADSQEKAAASVPVDVRMCKDCRHTVFGRSDFAREASTMGADQRAYQNLKQFERGIRLMLPRFQKLLQALQDPDRPPTPSQLAEATKVRKRLTESFTQYDVAARRIRDLPTESQTQLRLQRQIYNQAASFLHLHMLPLRSLPKVLKHASPHGHASANGHLSPGHADRGPLAAIKREHSRSPSGDNLSLPSSASRLSSLETEEKQLREELIVLEEQRFMVGEMVADAQRRRKFEEVEALGRNVDDLSREIDRVQGILENVRAQFEGVYTENPG